MYRSMALGCALATCISTQALALWQGDCGDSIAMQMKLKEDGYVEVARADVVLEKAWVKFYAAGRGKPGDLTFVLALDYAGRACVVMQLTNWKDTDERRNIDPSKTNSEERRASLEAAD